MLVVKAELITEEKEENYNLFRILKNVTLYSDDSIYC